MCTCMLTASAYCAGKILDDSQPLAKYKIQPNGFVVVMVSKSRPPPKPAAEEVFKHYRNLVALHQTPVTLVIFMNNVCGCVRDSLLVLAMFTLSLCFVQPSEAMATSEDVSAVDASTTAQET